MSSKSKMKDGAKLKRFFNVPGMLGVIAAALLSPLKFSMDSSMPTDRPAPTDQGAIAELERQLANARTKNRKIKLEARILKHRNPILVSSGF